MLQDVFRERAGRDASGAVVAVAEEEAADDGSGDGEDAMEVDTPSTTKGNDGGSCDAAAGGKPPPPPLSLARMGATGGPGSGRSTSFTATPSSSVGTPQSPGVDRAGMPRLGSRCAVCLVQKKVRSSPARVSLPI